MRSLSVTKILAIFSAAALLSNSFMGCSSESKNISSDNNISKTSLLAHDLKEILNYTIMAPSGHNTQPWKFKVEGNNIKMYPDFSRRLPAVDSTNRELFISLGCALENLTLAANEFGYDTNIAFEFSTEGPEYININLTKGQPKHSALFKAIPIRQCTRNKYDGVKVIDSKLQKIKETCVQDGADVIIYANSPDVEKMLLLIKEGNTIQFKNKQFLGELKSWIRFSKSEAEEKKDGLRSASLDNPSVPRWLGSLFMDLFLTVNSQNDKDEENVRSSAGLLLITTKNDDKESWINAGRVYQRFALLAASMNIKNAFMNQPVEVNELKIKLKKDFSLDGRSPQLLVRFGYSTTMPVSKRRNLEDVLL